MIQPNETYAFKLVSGEEVIAKVISNEGEYLKISAPISLTATQQGMGLVPSMFTAKPDGNFALNINSVAICADVDEHMKTKYIEATTGLKVPDKKLILG
jgi:hypothetical protein